VDVPLSTSTVLATRDQLFSTNEQLALAGFLAGYSGLTREAYTLDLRQYVAWCTEHRMAVFGARRADIECFARHLESLGRARATIARRLCTVACFYRYVEQEGLIAVSPAAHVRRPRLDYESHATGLDRNEVGAMLVAAGLAGARDHALISLLALNGLRVSEAIGADIQDLGFERGHRTLTIVRKGGKVVTVPLAPRTARAIDLAVGERCDGPIFVGTDGARIDRHAAGRVVRRIARHAGRQAGGTPHLASRVHNRRARCWRAAARRPGGRQPCRSPDHHALRPGPSLTRPARHLHRGHIPRRREPLTRICPLWTARSLQSGLLV
jgi:integrase/recombinase XerD